MLLKYKKYSISFILLLIIIQSSGCIQNNNDTSYPESIVLIEGKEQQFNSIQAAIDNASDGDKILVYPGIYFEMLEIDKSIMLKSTDQHLCTIAYPKNKSGTIISITSDSCTIEGFNIEKTVYDDSLFIVGMKIFSSKNIITRNYIRNTSYAIQIESDTSKNQIRNNNLINNKNGIELWKSHYNEIMFNNVSNNSVFGVVMAYESHDNKIMNNTFWKNEQAIRLTDTYENIITRNKLISNTKGIVICCGSRDNVIYDNIET